MKYTVWTNETTIMPKGGLEKRYFGHFDENYASEFSVSSDISSDE